MVRLGRSWQGPHSERSCLPWAAHAPTTLARQEAPSSGLAGTPQATPVHWGGEQGKAPKATIFAPDLQALERLLRAGKYPVNSASMSP